MRISRRTKQAVEEHARGLMAKNNVVAVGAGLEEKDGKKTGREAVLVLVKKKLPLSQLTDKDLVPRSLDADEVATDVIEVGEIKALVGEHEDEHRPLVPGTSVGHFRITAGTLGLVVQKNGVPYILSNNHVLANTNAAKVGDPIYQPGPIDGGQGKHEVGVLAKFVPISFTEDNTVDAALASITLELEPPVEEPPVEPPVEEPPVEEPPVEPPVEEPPVEEPPVEPPKEEKKDFFEKIFEFIEKLFKKILFFIDWDDDDDESKFQSVDKQEVGAPQAVKGVDFVNVPLNFDGEVSGMKSDVDVGDAVKKSGRTTGFTVGEVIAVNAVSDVNYGALGVAHFVDQIITTAFSAGGDSGSAVFDDEGNLIGLLFAGSETVTILNKIDNVFEQLEIDGIS